MKTDDPNLTAYALDELDPAERAAVEELLRADAAAAAEVEDTRKISALLRHTLHAETAPGLKAGQREEVLAAQGQPAATPLALPEPRRTLGWRVWVPTAIAATVVVGTSVWYWQIGGPFRPSPLHVVTSGDTGPAAPERLDGDQAAAAREGQEGAAARLSGEKLGREQAPRDLAESKKMAEIPKSDSGLVQLPMPAPAATPQPMISAITTVDPASGGALAPRQAERPLGADNDLKMERATKALEDASQMELAKREAQPVLPAPEPKPGEAVQQRLKAQAAAAVPQKKMPLLAENSPAAPSAVWAQEKAWERPVRRIDSAGKGLGGVLPSEQSKAKESMDPAALRSRAVMPGAFVAGLSPEALPEAEVTRVPAPIDVLRQNTEPGNTEAYDSITDNAFLTVKENPLSTFSIDVDTASYSNVRRFLTQGVRPPKGAVRIEELVNYFTYSYPQPQAGEPFSVNMEVAGCPWKPEHRLLRVGLKAREIPKEERPAANLVFLIDVSGSMQPANKLPLVKQSLRLLIDQLGPNDSVAMAVYAGASGTVLEPTTDKNAMRQALDRLEAGGSTNGGAGLRLAYDLARRSFAKEKNNRVILASDGDFNVGTTSQSELVELITAKAKSGVFLTVLGFGYGNLKDSTMEKLADKGNGNYAYVDSLKEGRKVLVEQMAGTLFTVCKDVKIQIEFNPAQVSGYRLIGYENRILAKEDFNDDKKDAGEIGAGHTVTALYELVPANAAAPQLSSVDPLKYQPQAKAKEAPAIVSVGGAEGAAAQESLTLKLRWKAPDADVSTLREFPLKDAGLTYEKSSRDFRWAAAVAGFGMLLRDSPHKAAATWESTRELAVEGRGEQADEYRDEFLTLIDKAAALAK